MIKINENYVEKSNNLEKVYDVYINEEQLKKLLDEIVRKTSYIVKGLFLEYAFDLEVDIKRKKILSGAELPNGDPKYINIEKMYRCESDSPVSYHDDSIAIEGEKVVPPQLASVICNLLCEKKGSINEFLIYGNNDELISIDQKIESLDKSINEINNFNTDEKIKQLKMLKYLCLKKKDNEVYDVNLLREYYLNAYELIELKLISEKRLLDSESVSLKTFKHSR